MSEQQPSYVYDPRNRSVQETISKEEWQAAFDSAPACHHPNKAVHIMPVSAPPEAILEEIMEKVFAEMDKDLES